MNGILQVIGYCCLQVVNYSINVIILLKPKYREFYFIRVKLSISDNLSFVCHLLSPVPGRVQEVLLTDSTNSSLTFSWFPPPCGQRGGPITSYKYLVLTEDGEDLIEDITSSTHVTLTRLPSCTTFEILVKARNDHENLDGMYSPRSNGTTAVASESSFCYSRTYNIFLYH